MNRILENLYYGNWHPNEQIDLDQPEIHEFHKKLVHAVNDLKETLPGEQSQRLEGVLDLMFESKSMYAEAAYIQGFATGALLMIEIFQMKDQFQSK